MSTKSGQAHLQLRVEQLRPLLLASLDKFTPEEFGRTLKLLVSWSVRSLVTGTAGSGTLESQYCLRAKDIREGHIPRANKILGQMHGAIPTDREFEAAFAVARVSQNALAHYYVRALERTVRGDDRPELVPNEETVITLEHVLPEHPSADWQDTPAETVRAYWQRLGNMALMQGRANRGAGADSFSEKAARYRRSEFHLTAELASYTSWGAPKIEQRQVHLAALALRTWLRGGDPPIAKDADSTEGQRGAASGKEGCAV